MRSIWTLLAVATAFLLAPWIHAKLLPPRGHIELWPDGSPKVHAAIRRTGAGADVYDGLFQSWFEHGAKESEGLYRNGQRQGTWHFWYETGARLGECEYDQGEGPFRCYAPDGHLLREGRYADVRRVGVWTEWYPSGRKRMQGPFENDVQDGVWSYWTDEDSPRLRVVRWRGGERQGELTPDPPPATAPASR